MEILEIKNLSFTYPECQESALKNITLSVKSGEFNVICGESGCGKSTLLRLIKKQIAPFGELNGEILYNGMRLDLLDERASTSEIGFILQNPESQIVTDTVWHELSFGLENLGLPQNVIRRRVAEMASYFGIEEWFYKKTADLSGGQKQLLNLAAVMAMQPKILLLDEPTAQLDPIAASNFIATLQKLNRELGLTVLMVEHRLEELMPIADKVLLLESGEMKFFDTPRNIVSYFKERKNHPVYDALPAAVRIYDMCNGSGNCPLSVREGREFVTENYSNNIDTVKYEPYVHSDEKAIELKDVWFRYEKSLPDVLKNTSFTVFRGEHFCILGGNGAGKTTALGIISGNLKAYSGKVMINGKKIGDYKGNSLYLKNIALLSQNPEIMFLQKTVYEDLLQSCKLMGYSDEISKNKTEEISEKLRIQKLLNNHPYDLSGGEQQKAALAKILLLEPEILLLDEPTKAIDAGSKRVLSKILKELKSQGITIITVTHDVEFAAENADRCGMFFNGELTSLDTPNEFFGENNFYTTAANRISRGFYKNAVLCSDVAKLCKLNEENGVER